MPWYATFNLIAYTTFGVNPVNACDTLVPGLVIFPESKAATGFVTPPLTTCSLILYTAVLPSIFVNPTVNPVDDTLLVAISTGHGSSPVLTTDFVSSQTAPEEA